MKIFLHTYKCLLVSLVCNRDLSSYVNKESHCADSQTDEVPGSRLSMSKRVQQQDNYESFQDVADSMADHGHVSQDDIGRHVRVGYVKKTGREQHSGNHYR